MGKQGPCCHCGVTSTPLWRNGPPEKPVLCNACGSRWRTKGSLTNYVPMHARESLNSDESNVSKIKSMTFKFKEQKLQKKRPSNCTLESECEMKYCDQNFHKVVEGDTSNQSSSESAISGSESFVHFGTTAASDVTGPVPSNGWDSLVPSKKRTFFTRPKPSPVEKLTKDLHIILHEEQASNLSRTSEDDLLYESATALSSWEIGYGGILIKHPNSKSTEEESEASSFPIDKSYITSESYSGSAPFIINTENKRTFLSSGINTIKPTAQTPQENSKRDRNLPGSLKILQDRSSPLGCVDLDVFINFEGFMKYLTYEEQQLLMTKYLPSIDTAEPHESLKRMFVSPQFLETLSYFQQLLQEGVFDLSLPGVNVEECRTLKRLALLNSTNLKWLECYQKIKDTSPTKIQGNQEMNRQNLPSISNFASLKEDNQKKNYNHSEQKSTMRSPKRLRGSWGMHPPSKWSCQLESSVVSKATDNVDDPIDGDGACFSSRRDSLSVLDRSCMPARTCLVTDDSDSNLLLDVPSSATFREAELLHHPWAQKKNQNVSGLQVSDHPS
ncbi:GATA transcription factor 26-like isoform X2 [Canna indica]|uniref:GATA transcription factor 26-like isoform X2 n=1 Tax=Canna indica TaxID=4628 RepID=A0AAQ3KMU8_9LILI|nr:GATA transcription factor 26-like isoform X2 [Canna indica]